MLNIGLMLLFKKMKPDHAIFNRIKASPRCYPHTHFTRVESDNTPDTKEIRSLLTLAVSYGAVGTGAAHQYAEPQHQNKLRLPKCSTPLCGLLLLYLSQPNTIHWSKLIASVGKVKEDGTRLKDYRRFATEKKAPGHLSKHKCPPSPHFPSYMRGKESCCFQELTETPWAQKASKTHGL